MANQGTHYEQAFEALLVKRRIRYVALDQAQKALFAGVQLKSFDFIVHTPSGRMILADIKGRKLSRRAFEKHRCEQTWTTRDDVKSLQDWSNVFGPTYSSAFIFAYWIAPEKDQEQLQPSPNDPPEAALQPHPNWQTILQYGGRDYVFVAAELADYRRAMRARSRSWNTVYVPTSPFRQLAQPLDTFLTNTHRPLHVP